MNSNEYMNKYMKARYKSRRDEAIVSLGGRCNVCGTSSKLEFDHIDYKNKEFSISKIMLHSTKKLHTELSKCQLLCKPCHINKTRLERGQEDARKTHGTLSSYKYCRCDSCKKAQSKWMKDYRARRKKIAT